jgi:DNA-binding HxlR family transcriptional regulator
MAVSKSKIEHPSPTQCKATLNAIADALYVIGGKWKLHIIVALRERSACKLTAALIWNQSLIEHENT